MRRHGDAGAEMTLRTWARLVVIVLAAALVQVGLLNQIVLGEAHPDVFVLLAVAAGLVAGPQRGAVIGFVLGLVADVFVQTPYGLSSLCYVLVAFAVGLVAATVASRPTLGFQAAAAFLGASGAHCSSQGSARSSTSRACHATNSLSSPRSSPLPACCSSIRRAGCSSGRSPSRQERTVMRVRSPAAVPGEHLG